MVDWYVEVIEDGVKTKDVLHEYHDLKKKYNKLQKQYDTFKIEQKLTRDKLKTRLSEHQSVLKRQ